MPALMPSLLVALHEPSETERLGESLYAEKVRAHVEPEHNGEFIALDIDSGEYCVDADELAALRGLRARRPAARVYFARVGEPVVYELRGPTELISQQHAAA